MSWSAERIEKDLLLCGLDALAIPPETILSAVERVECRLGAEWIASAMRAKGIAPFMNVACMGLQLRALDGISNSDRLLDHLRQDDQGSRAELTAIYLFRSRDSSLTVELEPQIGVRKADFRVRKGTEPWTTVEVTRPLASKEEKSVYKVIDSLATALAGVNGQFSLQVLLSRKLTVEETEWLLDRLPEFCRLDGPQRATLVDGMGYLFLNHVEVGRLLVPEVPEFVGRPRVGLTVFTGGGPGGGPRNQVTVQALFSDERGDDILRREAKQLPKDAPGLIMIETVGSAGTFEVWSSFITRRFQPRIHTRVGGVCLLSSFAMETTTGQDCLVNARLLTNPYAKQPLPAWIEGMVASARQDLARRTPT